MPSTDIDGSIIVILSAKEARRVHDCLRGLITDYEMSVNDTQPRTQLDYDIVNKIARDLNLPPLE